MGVRDFRELRVFQDAFDGSLAIHNHTKQWPRDERFRLIDQIVRSSRSVCLNIGEAWGRRRYPGAFVTRLTDAEAAARETIVSLMFAKAARYLAETDAAALMKRYDGICAQLFEMIRNPRQ